MMRSITLALALVVFTALGCAREVTTIGGNVSDAGAPDDAAPGDDDDDDVPAPPSGDDDDDDTQPPGPGPGADTSCTTCYFRDIQPLLERSCYACHAPGGFAPFSFTEPAEAQDFAPAMLDAIERGIMPPYFAKQSCNSTKDDPRFSDVEKALFRAWVEEGTPLGDPADEVHAPGIVLPTIDPDVEFDIGADFDVATASTGPADVDIYRCFDVDLGFAEDTVVKAYDVLPGNNALVHHLLGYYVTPDTLSELQQNDANDDGPGYSCESAGPNISGSLLNMALSWVPGALVSRFPEGTGITIPAGSHLVVQIHYNTVGAAPGDTVDRTSFFFETAPAGSVQEAHIVPATQFDLNIAAGDPHSVQQNILGRLVDFDVWSWMHGMVFQGTRVYAATGHAHFLATNIRLDVIHADDTEDCLFENEPWDFHWQRSYTLSEPFDIARDDALRITCTYNNTQANQPVIDGVQQTPHDVQWGERTVDEMCMVYLTFVEQ